MKLETPEIHTDTGRPKLCTDTYLNTGLKLGSWNYEIAMLHFCISDTFPYMSDISLYINIYHCPYIIIWVDDFQHSSDINITVICYHVNISQRFCDVLGLDVYMINQIFFLTCRRKHVHTRSSVRPFSWSWAFSWSNDGAWTITWIFPWHDGSKPRTLHHIRSFCPSARSHWLHTAGQYALHAQSKTTVLVFGLYLSL